MFYPIAFVLIILWLLGLYTTEGSGMFGAVVAVLFVLWLLGFVSSYTIEEFVRILLAIAVTIGMTLFNLIMGLTLH